MSLLEQQDTLTRMFIGLPVPEAAQETITKGITQYANYTDRIVPKSRWHITFLFLGDVLNYTQYLSRLSKPLEQAYLPTISVTHLGRGLQRDQLWAYVHTTQVVTNMRGTVVDRLKKMRMPIPEEEKKRAFTPHIHIADFFPVAAGIGIADEPISATFPVHELYLYRSKQTDSGSEYVVEATIPLAA